MICFGEDYYIKRPMVIRNAYIPIHVYFVIIACKSIIDNNVYTEWSVIPILFLSEKLTFLHMS